jgi:hypothetical protein
LRQVIAGDDVDLKVCLDALEADKKLDLDGSYLPPP